MKKPRKPTQSPAATNAPVAPKTVIEPKPQPPAKPLFVWRRHLPVLALLWIAAALVYSNSFSAGLTFDNAATIQMDPRIRAANSENISQIFHEDYWFPTETIGLFRPLTTLSFLFNYTVLGNGVHPGGYHALNLALQMVGIALVFLLGLLLLEDRLWAALLAAVWTFHPLLTESVTNIVGRADQLAGLGVFGGLLCHIRAGKSAGGARALWLGGLLLFAAIGIFAKESGVVLLAALLLYDIVCDSGRAWTSRIANYFVILVPFAVFFWLRAQMQDHTPTPLLPFIDNPISTAAAPAAFMTAMKVIGKYLLLYLWPIPLSADYSYNQIPVAVDFGGILALVVCLAAAAGALVAWRRGQRLLCFAVLLFFATLAPTSNVFLAVGSIMAERWMYVPTFALALLVILGLQALQRRLPNVPRQALVGAVAVLCLAWGARAYVRNFDWHDDQSLWRSAETVAPGSYKAASMLANLLAISDHPSLDEAIQQSERSLAILNPLGDEENISRPWAVAGMCYRMKGDSIPDPAQKQIWYRKALDALLHARRIDLAEQQHMNRINEPRGKGQIQTGSAVLYLELGRLQRRMSLAEDALQSFDYGRNLAPLPDFAEEKSLLYRDQGKSDLAAVALFEGMILDPHSRQLAGKIVQLYEQTETLTCAIDHGPSGAAFNQQCPLVHGHICDGAANVVKALRQFGKLDQAVTKMNYAIYGLGCPANLF